MNIIEPKNEPIIMNRTFYIVFTIILTIGITSCNFETENYQQTPTEQAYQTLQDVKNGMNGAYRALGSRQFLGNYALIYADVCANITNGNSSTGYFYSQSNWVIADTDYEMENIWNYGYKVIDRCTRTIQGGKDILSKTSEKHLNEEEIAQIKSYMAQCHAMKALANYYLVNYFALPYHKGIENLGIPLVKDLPIEPFTTVERATVGKTYQQIIYDLEEAEKLTEECGIEPNAFYMGSMAIQALKARIYLDMGEYDIAQNAALKAIELKGSGNGTGEDNVPTDEIYTSMWTSLAITSEDIFTIAKNESDNLASYSLNNYYNGYGLTLTLQAINLFSPNDIRFGLVGENQYGSTTTKYDGIPTSSVTSNIPIFRKSEMSLIVAETEARAGNIDNARNYLYYTAKRNKDITSAQMLPDSTDELLQYIADERVREFLGEGHRFFDARRMNLKIELQNFDKPFDIANFVFPIPATEISAGFCTQQNEGWETRLPQ